MATDASWLPDPSGAHELRYWDGASWTAHVSDGGVAAESPVPADAPLPPPPAAAPPPPPPPPPAGTGSWKDKLKSAAQTAATQGKQMADQAKSAIGEQQQKRLETAAAPDIAEQLRKLAGLRDEGILSEEEFAAQKARLLA